MAGLNNDQLFYLSLLLTICFQFFIPTTGVRIGLFTPGQAFDVVCRKQIEALKHPSTKVVDLVTQEINAIVKDSFSKVKSCQVYRQTIWAPLIGARLGKNVLSATELICYVLFVV